MTRSPSVETLPEQFQSLRGDYQASKSTAFRRRRTGVIPTGTGADWHYRVEANFLGLMEQARDMDRNDTVVGQLVDRAVGNTIQEGIRMDACTGDEQLDLDLEARWHDWCHDPDECDVMGENTFVDLEHLALRHMFVDGDIFAIPLQEGCLQFIEGHRCRTPQNTTRNVVHGILLDERRKRLECWFTKDDIPAWQAFNLVSSAVRYPVRDEQGHRQVFQVYSPKRYTQTRGVTAFAPIFDPLAMFEDINFAKLVQQQVVSCFAVIREQPLATTYNSPAIPGAGPTSSVPMSDGSTRTTQGYGPGMQYTGKPGEKLSGFSPNVPNAEFFDHVRLILTLIGINLGLPLVMTLMDARETTYAGFRGALDQARLGFKRNQKLLTNRLHRPTYQWKVRQWMALDSALRRAAGRSGINIFGHRWNPPTWQYIEPLKDAQADAFRLKEGLVDPYSLHAENGADADQVTAGQVRYNSRRIVAAMKEAEQIEAATGIAVDWHELLAISGVNPMTLKPAGDEPDPQGQEPGQPAKPGADEEQESEDDDTD